MIHGRLDAALNRRITMKLVAVLCSALALVFSTGAAAESKIVIKFSHVVAEKTPKGQGAL